MKQSIRASMLAKRRALSSDEVISFSQQIIQHLLQLHDFRKARVILTYVPHDNEVEHRDVLQQLFADSSVRVIVPKVNQDTKEMALHEIASFDDLETGYLGVLEPKNSGTVSLDDVDLIIVPGVAFDKQGNRIGYGLGYFDGLLRDTQVRVIALAYSFQVVDKVPAERHDHPVDLIVTEQGVIDCRS